MYPEYALGDKIYPVPVIVGRQEFFDKKTKPSCAYFTPRMARKAIYRQESCAFYINLRQADTHWGPWHTPHWIGTVRSAFPRQTGQTR